MQTIINSINFGTCILWSCRAVGALSCRRKTARFADTFLECSAPGSASEYTKTQEAQTETKHHRELSTKCPQNKRRRPLIYAGRKEEDRFIMSLAICCCNILLYYSSDVRVPSLSHSLFYLSAACLAACGAFHRIARKCH